MTDQKNYYLVPIADHWQLKRAGGIRILKVFSSKTEALVYAQALVSKQRAFFRVQNKDGTWENM